MDIAMESLAITMLKKYKDIVLKSSIRRLLPLYFWKKKVTDEQ